MEYNKESTMPTARITPFLLALFLSGTFVATSANAGPTRTCFDSNRGTFARWFKKAPIEQNGLEQLVARWNGVSLPWQDQAMRLTIPVPEAIIVITESEGDSTDGAFTDSTGPREISFVGKEESHGDDDSDEFEFTYGHTVQEGPIAIEDQ
jgi:hypothetical protein